MTTRIETRSALILLATLLIGALLGALITGALAQRRISRVAEMRERGFGMHIERIIQPRDEEQREALRAVLEVAAQRHQEIMRGAREQLEDQLRQMREELFPLLDEEQRQRLESAAEGFRPGGFRGPPGPSGRGRPGPGRRPHGERPPGEPSDTTQ
jgi:uncharacterized membrane protein